MTWARLPTVETRSRKRVRREGDPLFQRGVQRIDLEGIAKVDMSLNTLQAKLRGLVSASRDDPQQVHRAVFVSCSEEDHLAEKVARD